MRLLGAGAAAATAVVLAAPASATLKPPPAGRIYQGAFPFVNGDENVVVGSQLKAFETLAGKRLAWAQFSDNWFERIAYPRAKVKLIAGYGVVPYVRMMTRSSWSERKSSYTQADIAAGKYDSQLTEYGRAIVSTGVSILLDYDVEPDGNWFPWSGNPVAWTKAYSHVIDVLNAAGARHFVTYVWHLDCEPDPSARWNSFRAYYPSALAARVDWLGVSAYGSDDIHVQARPLRSILDGCYRRLAALDPTKPLALLETGTVEAPGKASWIRRAYADLSAGRWPRIRAVSWWNQKWDHNDTRIDSSRSALAAYRKAIAGRRFTGTPVFG